MMNWNDPQLDKFCTKKQLQALNAMRKTGDIGAAGELIGKAYNTVHEHLTNIKIKAGVNIEQDSSQKVNFKEQLNELSGKYRRIVGKNRFNLIVTSAQNDTDVHGRFLRNLQRLEKEENANLLVIPFRYKNPTSMFVDKPIDYWDSRLHPYICEDDFDVNDNLSILGKLKTQPTAKRPLSGLESETGGKSAIIGHTKIELKAVASPCSRMPSLLISTGCCTVPNYTDSAVGYKAGKRHRLGAIFIQVRGRKFFPWVIFGDENGDFIHMRTLYEDGKAKKAPRAQVLSTGDLHGVNSDPQAVNATFFNKDSMLKYFDPMYVTLDDTLDFESGSHHNKRDPLVQYELSQSGANIVENELKNTFSIVDRIIDSSRAKIVIKRSNHDEHFERWVKETDPRSDVDNWLTWCDASKAMMSGRDPFEYFAEKWLKNYKKVRFLQRDEQFRVGNVAHDGHGDLGMNGSRGSLQQFTKLGSPGQWGHSHFPGIMDDQFQNGTLSKLRKGYNKGPSSWMHTNTIQYGNGMRSLMFIIDGWWRF